MLIGVFAGGSTPACVGAAVFSALWMWPTYTDLFRRAFEIRLDDTGRLEFEAALRTIRLNAHELVSIRKASWTTNDQAYLVVRHQNGKFWIAWPLYSFDDFLDRLRHLNPTVEVAAPQTLVPKTMPRTTAALPADEAPWGHDGIPTVGEAVRAHPFFAAFVGFFPLFILGVLFQETQDNFWPYLFIPFMPAMWWLLIWLNVRGWITFDD